MDSTQVVECKGEPYKNQDGVVAYEKCLGVARHKGGPKGGWNSIAKNYDTDDDGLIWKSEMHVLNLASGKKAIVGDVKADFSFTMFDTSLEGSNPEADGDLLTT